MMVLGTPALSAEKKALSTQEAVQLFEKFYNFVIKEEYGQANEIVQIFEKREVSDKEKVTIRFWEIMTKKDDYSHSRFGFHDRALDILYAIDALKTDQMIVQSLLDGEIGVFIFSLRFRLFPEENTVSPALKKNLDTLIEMAEQTEKKIAKQIEEEKHVFVVTRLITLLSRVAGYHYHAPSERFGYLLNDTFNYTKPDRKRPILPDEIFSSQKEKIKNLVLKGLERMSGWEKEKDYQKRLNKETYLKVWLKNVAQLFDSRYLESLANLSEGILSESTKEGPLLGSDVLVKAWWAARISSSYFLNNDDSRQEDVWKSFWEFYENWRLYNDEDRQNLLYIYARFYQKDATLLERIKKNLRSPQRPRKVEAGYLLGRLAKDRLLDKEESNDLFIIVLWTAEDLKRKKYSYATGNRSLTNRTMYYFTEFLGRVLLQGHLKETTKGYAKNVEEVLGFVLKMEIADKALDANSIPRARLKNLYAELEKEGIISVQRKQIIGGFKINLEN